MAKKFLTGADMNSQRITSVADPSSGQDAANKQYVDNVAAGLLWKANVRAASTANMAVATAVINGASMDGVTLATGDRVLLKNQTSGGENGVYIVAVSGAASRASDADTAAEVKGMAVRVAEGSTNADSMWQLITDGAITLGTTSLVYTQFGGGASYTADGNGVELSGNVISLELDGSSLSKSSSGVRIADAAAGSGLTGSAGILAVGAGTGISVAADTVGIDTSVVSRKFSADCAATTNPQTFTHNLGTKDVQVVVRQASDDSLVEADITAATTNTVSVNFGGAPTSAQYRVTVIG